LAVRADAEQRSRLREESAERTQRRCAGRLSANRPFASYRAVSAGNWLALTAVKSAAGVGATRAT
jgi:hypothetical protein